MSLCLLDHRAAFGDHLAQIADTAPVLGSGYAEGPFTCLNAANGHSQEEDERERIANAVCRSSLNVCSMWQYTAASERVPCRMDKPHLSK